MNANFITAACLAMAASLTPAADAAPLVMNFFCTATGQQSNVFYLTGTFAATAEVRVVNDAWRRYIAGQHADTKAHTICQAGVDLSSLEALRTLTHDSTASTAPDVVDVDWKYTAE